MSKPTNEQVKEFWELIGFTVYEKDGGKIWWNYPDGSYKGLRLPPIDLNNLFKYAVPKVHHGLGITVIIYSGGGDTMGNIVVELKKSGKRVIPLEMDEEDPALALFWAIYKVRCK